MPNLTGAKVDNLFCMFKGEPGTRKSTQTLSFPRPIYYFDIDRKINALINPARAWNIPFSEIEFDIYKDYNTVRQKLEQLQLNCKYKTIVLDSITSQGDAINRQTIRLKSGTTTKSGDEKGMRIGGIPVNSIEDYKAEASAFSETVALLKEIHEFHGVNVVMIAHVIGDRDSKQDEQTHFARIIVTGGKIISAKIPAYCPEVYHFNVENSMDMTKEGSYGLMTVHTGNDFARTALPLDRKIVFNNQQLYSTYLQPAIEKLKGK